MCHLVLRHLWWSCHVFDSNVWPWYWRSRTLRISMIVRRRRSLVNMHMYAEICPSMFDRLFAAQIMICMRIGRQTYLVNVRDYVWIFWAIVIKTNQSQSECLSGSGVHFAADVHNYVHTYVRTYIRTNDHTTCQQTPVQRRTNGEEQIKGDTDYPFIAVVHDLGIFLMILAVCDARYCLFLIV